MKELIRKELKDPALIASVESEMEAHDRILSKKGQIKSFPNSREVEIDVNTEIHYCFPKAQLMRCYNRSEEGFECFLCSEKYSPEKEYELLEHVNLHIWENLADGLPEMTDELNEERFDMSSSEEDSDDDIGSETSMYSNLSHGTDVMDTSDTEIDMGERSDHSSVIGEGTSAAGSAAPVALSRKRDRQPKKPKRT